MNKKSEKKKRVKIKGTKRKKNIVKEWGRWRNKVGICELPPFNINIININRSRYIIIIAISLHFTHNMRFITHADKSNQINHLSQTRRPSSRSSPPKPLQSTTNSLLTTSRRRSCTGDSPITHKSHLCTSNFPSEHVSCRKTNRGKENDNTRANDPCHNGRTDRCV